MTNYFYIININQQLYDSFERKDVQTIKNLLKNNANINFSPEGKYPPMCMLHGFSTKDLQQLLVSIKKSKPNLSIKIHSQTIGHKNKITIRDFIENSTYKWILPFVLD